MKPDKLRAAFPVDMMVQVSTWRDLQGALLAAVQMETTILNILLFLIIAVAGFGILATFFMIVVEKTKDIGILKSLGASGSESPRFSSVTVSCLVPLALEWVLSPAYFLLLTSTKLLTSWSWSPARGI